jgi:sulfite reductase (ferredoxin)
MKYLIAEWGIEKFKAKVEEYYGAPLPAPHPADVTGFDDHIGWFEQGDGRWFYGLNIENGRVVDTERQQLRSALREICQVLNCDMRLTTHQSLLFINLTTSQKAQLESILHKHQVITSDQITTVRRWSMACVAWPTCGLAITESERALPGVIDELEKEIATLGLGQERFTIRMTGCPNGCARPYNADVGLVGKAKDRYTLYLGGQLLGTRLGFIYKDLVPREKLSAEITSVLKLYQRQRLTDETFGDYCARVGKEELLKQTEETVEAV